MNEARRAAAQRFAYEPVDDGLAVADALTNQITLLNAGAALAWLALSDGPRSLASLAAELRALGAGGSGDLSASLPPLLETWQTMGWVRCDADGAWHLLAEATGPSPAEGPAGAENVAADNAVAWRRRIALSDTCFDIEIRTQAELRDSDDMRRLTGVLGGLPQASSGAGVARLSLDVGAQQVRLRHAGGSHAFADFIAASALFNLAAVQAAYPRHRAHSILHAAAVCRAVGAIILPAVSGSGKTTLTAFLTAKGWAYGGDDIIGLGRSEASGAPELLPFPTALGIKTGSVDILLPHYPQLATAPLIAYGSKHVRFIGVEPARLVPEGGSWRRPRALVFPAYAAAAPCALTPISEWQALELLLESGTGTGDGTDLDSFALLIEIIRTVPRYRLHYGRLDDAAEALEALLAGP